MPPIHIMLKPASGNCNLRCTYCFYSDVKNHRTIENYGMMSLNTLKNIVRKVLTHATGECTIAFQGGEPTLVGLDFYRTLVILQKKHNVKNLVVRNAIQTNGICLDDEWCSFFSENNFLVGLSIDGIKELNDKCRIDTQGNGTYNRLIKVGSMMNKHKTDFNILTVISAQVARKIHKVYNQYKKNGWMYLQFIPCLDPLDEQRGMHRYSLTPSLYTYFLKTLFDLWYEDMVNGKYIYIRYFENLVGMVMNMPPESCGMSGVCSRQYIAEADGSIFPCDFYVMDGYKIGNLNTDSFNDLERNRATIDFIGQSVKLPSECTVCDWLHLCRGGCRRDREIQGVVGINYYCSSYKEFFQYAYKRLQILAQKASRNN
ncbi:Anaerobic sulfatase-maturating enzyme [Sporomusa aerivorans]